MILNQSALSPVQKINRNMVNTIWFWVDWTRIYLRFLLNKPKSDCIYRIPMVICILICILNFMLQKITTTYALKSPIVLILSWLKHKAFTNLLLNVVPDLVEVGGLGREPPLLLCRQGCHTAGQAYQQPRYETLHLNRNTNMLKRYFSGFDKMLFIFNCRQVSSFRDWSVELNGF